ncbi:hypothetical protein NDU88_005304 [Pleurodeles waltl]|uniref:Uncharacterized protein n=1 Tax=Pleurodeles waltl TaxID=8319 RepID=A0AAV7SLG3_PLEWA|nr:hypothetical protein NDU88_005304 [Pleurodeles waltl]
MECGSTPVVLPFGAAERIKEKTPVGTPSFYDAVPARGRFLLDSFGCPEWEHHRGRPTLHPGARPHIIEAQGRRTHFR